MIRRHALRPLSPRHISTRCVPILLLLCSSVPTAQTPPPHHTARARARAMPSRDRRTRRPHGARLPSPFYVATDYVATDMSRMRLECEPPVHAAATASPRQQCAPLPLSASSLLVVLLLPLGCCVVVLGYAAVPRPLYCPTALSSSRQLVGHSAIFFLFLLVVARDVKCLQWK